MSGLEKVSATVFLISRNRKRGQATLLGRVFGRSEFFAASPAGTVLAYDEVGAERGYPYKKE
jgi:hypothetical protein